MGASTWILLITILAEVPHHGKAVHIEKIEGIISKEECELMASRIYPEAFKYYKVSTQCLEKKRGMIR